MCMFKLLVIRNTFISKIKFTSELALIKRSNHPHSIQLFYFKAWCGCVLNAAESWFKNNYIVKCIKLKTEKFSNFAA